jgi:hypothetical protein
MLGARVDRAYCPKDGVGARRGCALVKRPSAAGTSGGGEPCLVERDRSGEVDAVRPVFTAPA